MIFRRRSDGTVHRLELERIVSVHLTNVKDWFDTYAPGSDDKCLELVEATPNERRALRRAGFDIKPATQPGARPRQQNAARRRRAKKARAIQRARAEKLTTEATGLQHAA